MTDLERLKELALEAKRQRVVLVARPEHTDTVLSLLQVVKAAEKYLHGLETKAPTTEQARLSFDLRNALSDLAQREK